MNIYLKRSVFLAAVFFSFLVVLPVQAQEAPTLAITEIMYDEEGADTGREWIEVYNFGNDPVEVVVGSSAGAFRFFDGSNHTLSVVRGTSTIASHEFFIVAADGVAWAEAHPVYVGTIFDTVMALPNASSTIGLAKTRESPLFTSVLYDASRGGNGTGYTLERASIDDFSEEGLWAASVILGGTPGYWQASAQPAGDENADAGSESENTTPDEEPLIPEALTVPPVTELPSTAGTGGGGVPAAVLLPPVPAHTVRINELLPNPLGSDETEWIELYNTGAADVSLKGWALHDETGKKYQIKEGSISSQSFILFSRAETNIALNNTGGDGIFLYAADGSIHDSLRYENSAREGKSYAYFETGFQWTNELTPRAVNARGANNPPLASITVQDDDARSAGDLVYFDGSTSSDADGDTLAYHWDFGDGISDDESSTVHTFVAGGEYRVVLTVSDSRGGSDADEVLITVRAGESNTASASSAVLLHMVSISEFLPDPVGSDEAEWIELHNSASTTISLAGLTLDDEEGGSKPYTFSNAFSIASFGYLVIPREISKLALNNGDDEIRLFFGESEIDNVAYENAEQGYAYALSEETGKWFWAQTPSPGSVSDAMGDDTVVLGSELTIAEDARTLAELSDDSALRVEGVVISPPGLLGKNRFYVAPTFSDSGEGDTLLEVQVQSGDVTSISRGDHLRIEGVLETRADGRRMRVADPARDLVVVSSGGALPTPSEVSIAEINGVAAAQWVTLSGSIGRVYQKSFSLVDGEDSITVTLPDAASLASLLLKKGESVSVAGVAKHDASRARLYVIDAADVKRVVAVATAASETISSAATSTLSIAAVKKNVMSWWYLASIPGAVIVGLGIKKYILPRMQ